MRITEVETIPLRMPRVGAVCDGSQDAFVVRIVTDDGVDGIGEGDSIPSVLRAIFDAPVSNAIGMGLRELLVGQDPLQIEPLVQRMLDGTLYLGGAGTRLTAISAAEIALWDIAGKVYGAPISTLLGGRFREQLRAYASILFPEDPTDLDHVRRNAERFAAAGFTAVKFGWGGFGRDRRQDIALVRAARETLGPDIRLMVDVGLCWDLTTTLERAHDLAGFDLYWLEAPMPHEPVAAWADLCVRSPVRIACESSGGFWESERFLREGRLQVILPDVTNAGGIAAWKRIAQTAETHGAWCVPHAFSTGIVSAASLHLLANSPREHMIEWSMEGSPLNTDLTTPRPQMVDGFVAVPTTPGLGVSLDMTAVERYIVR